jgi:DNA-binding CsgD family transcriptional regulator
VRSTPPSTPPPGLCSLSDRQKKILEGLCRGEPNKIIGRALDLPESTVKVHVREIMRKLAVSNRTQVAIAVARMSSQSMTSQPASSQPNRVDEEPNRGGNEQSPFRNATPALTSASRARLIGISAQTLQAAARIEKSGQRSVVPPSGRSDN